MYIHCEVSINASDIELFRVPSFTIHLFSRRLCSSPVHLSPRLEGQVCWVVGGVHQGSLYLGEVRDGSVCNIAGKCEAAGFLVHVP